MALTLGRCGAAIMKAIDAVPKEDKSNRDAVFAAMGGAIEAYIADVLRQLKITVPPLGVTGSTTAPGLITPGSIT